MRRTLAGLVSVLGLVALLLSPVALAGAPRAAAEDFAAATGAPGVVVAVVDDHGAIREMSLYGEDGDGAPVTERTPFVWGSVSKSVTAFALLHSGIDLDAPVAEFLPGLADTGLERRGTTVTDLVNHTSGLPHDVSATDLARGKTALDVVTGPDSPVRDADLGPRGEFRYSSLNYLLLQAVLETRGPVDDAFAGAAPGVVTDPVAFRDDVPRGHVPFLGLDLAREARQDRAGLGYGYLAGSGETLARYAGRQLAAHTGSGELATAPSARVREGQEYSAGWYRRPGPGGGGPRYTHAGAVPGYYTHVTLAPDRGRAVVVLANRYGEGQSDRMTAEALRVTAGLLGDPDPGRPPRSWAYLGFLVGGLTLAAVLAGLAVRAVRRGRVSRAETVAAVAVTGLLCAAVVGGSMLSGYSPPVVWAWAPDVLVVATLLLVASVAYAGAAVATRGR